MGINNIIATFHRDGRSIVKSTDTRVVVAGDAIYVIFTFPELRVVEQVIHVEFETNPETWTQGYNLQDKTYLNNTVGISIYMDPAAGTTLTSEAVVIGY